MKIQDLSSLNNLIRSSTGVDRKEHEPKAFSFKQEMSQLTRANSEQHLREMSDAIDAQGALVGRRCDMRELKRYKEMIAAFMYEAVRFAYEFKKQSTLDARGRHRIYALIKRINQKLEELTQQMLSGEADNLTVMAAIDELRGMLVDLYM